MKSRAAAILAAPILQGVVVGRGGSHACWLAASGLNTHHPCRPSFPHVVAYNFVGVPVAAGALLPAFGIALSPSLAGGMMALSSIAVVSNSVSLRWTLDPSRGRGEGAPPPGAAAAGSGSTALGGSTS